LIRALSTLGGFVERQEIFPGRQLDVFVAELGYLVDHLAQGQVAVHVGVECDAHDFVLLQQGLSPDTSPVRAGLLAKAVCPATLMLTV
jgi:hypothetical protein